MQPVDVVSALPHLALCYVITEFLCASLSRGNEDAPRVPTLTTVDTRNGAFSFVLFDVNAPVGLAFCLEDVRACSLAVFTAINRDLFLSIVHI